MKRMFVNTPEGQVHCRTEGTGEPLLLLHQVPCSSDKYSDIMPILSPYFRVITMDLPVYGDSYRPTRPPDIEDFAQAALNVLDALGIKKTNVGGHHTGAAVTIELAAEHSERVNKLIVSGCPQ